MNHKDNIEEEVTFRELVILIRGYILYLLGFWKLGLLAVILFFGLGYWMSYTKEVKYEAELTFVVQDEEGGGGGGIASTLSSFGFGGIQKGKYNYSKIMELSKSQQVLFSVLLSEIDQTGQLTINELLKEVPIDTEDVVGIDSKYIDSLSLSQKRVLDNVYRFVKNSDNKYLSLNYDEESKILTLKSRAKSNLVALELVNKTYEELNEVYTMQAVKKQRNDLIELSRRLDSTKVVLHNKQTQLAKLYDRNNEFIFKVDKVKEERLKMDLQVTTIAYTEIIKNYETSQFLLSVAMPVFTIIDAPFQPLKVIPKENFKSGVKYSLVALFTMVFLLLIRKFYIDLNI